MKYVLYIAKDGRVMSATYEIFATPDSVLVDNLPNGNIYDYRYENDTFVYDPIKPIIPIPDQIASLKTQLSSTDYKIIKCSEAQLLGEELPYDIASLHAERQALRDKINELEQQLEADSENTLENTLENNKEGGAI